MVGKPLGVKAKDEDEGRKGSPWKMPRDIENGEEDQDEMITVAESCEYRQFIYDCITGGN